MNIFVSLAEPAARPSPVAPWIANAEAARMPSDGVPPLTPPRVWPTIPTDHDFMALHNAYRRLGGLARAHELGRVWATDGPEWHGRLDTLVDTGRVFAFHWHDGLWLPRFQLDRDTHDTTAPVRQVLDEFGATWDGWELASWFVEPNAWLDEQAPVDRLADALPRVLEAARADRFVRLG